MLQQRQWLAWLPSKQSIRVRLPADASGAFALNQKTHFQLMGEY